MSLLSLLSKIWMPWSLETKIWGTDLDGSNSHLPWGNSDLPIYISPITQAIESCFHVINWIKVSFCQSAYNAFYSSSSAEFLGCRVSWTQLLQSLHPNPVWDQASIDLWWSMLSGQQSPSSQWTGRCLDYTDSCYFVDVFCVQLVDFTTRNLTPKPLQSQCDFLDFAGVKTGSADQSSSPAGCVAQPWETLKFIKY